MPYANPTSTEVLPDTTGTIEDYIAAVTIVAGEVVYILAAGTVGLADADAASPAYTARGIALNGGVAGQPIRVQRTGTPTMGATFAAGVVSGDCLFLSSVAGKMKSGQPSGGSYQVVIGVVGETTTGLQLNIFNSGARKA